MRLLGARIPPRIEDVDALALRLRTAAQPYLADDRLDAFEIAVVEALTNAVRHAGLRPDQTVDVELWRVASGIEAVVSDEGTPLPSSLYDGALPDDPMAESGRGIGLIVACADDVETLREGPRNYLVLKFHGGAHAA